HGDLTGAQNTRFLARVYGTDTDHLCAYVRDFAELAQHFDKPVKSYSAGMRARLSFGIAMGIPFDVYLVDEVAAVGDERFRQKSRRVFETRLKPATAILVSHSLPLIKAVCDRVAVLHDGHLTQFYDLEAGLNHHLSNLKRPPRAA
ncbi:MAG: ABC transporter ATP-binding protein, partial [Pseudomonadota bacterium]